VGGQAPPSHERWCQDWWMDKPHHLTFPAREVVVGTNALCHSNCEWEDGVSGGGQEDLSLTFRAREDGSWTEEALRLAFRASESPGVVQIASNLAFQAFYLRCGCKCPPSCV
jgi:hypothetical protein